jgi:hypothetical protein
MVMGTSGLKRGIGLRKLITALGQLRGFGDYIESGADAQDRAVRTAKIRAGMKSLLLLAQLDIPPGALDPYLDYVAAKIASETAPEPE